MSQKIEDYALIGDCETAALVGRNGSIDWLCWPAFDSDACFAAILGTHKNGRWLITPSDEVTTISRRYLGNTLILETRFETRSGTVALVDFMPPRGKASDIVRLVRGLTGAVKLRMELVIRFGFGVDIPWVRRIDHSLLAVAGQDMTVLRTPVETHGEDLTTVAEFEVEAGETIPFVLTYGPSHLDPPEPIDPEMALRETEKFWNGWCRHCTRDGPYHDLIVRSLITLKALTFGPTGGIVAAPTTSLPEKLGGSRNWDYRFCWLRDATFTLLALMNSGYTEEALAWHNWLLRAAAGSPSNMQIMYGIWGQRRLLEWEAGWLDGYEGAKPVRVGNAAHAQLQLDVYGELIDAFHQSRMAKLKLDDEATWALECAVLQHLAEVWDQPDHGIWERRGEPRHYVFSKVMTWVAFDRAIKSAETFGFKAPLLHWRALREAIHRDVCNRGFDAEEGAFVESYGSKLLDASVLLLPGVGFLPADDPRVRGTIAAVEKHVMRDGFVLRHDPRELPADQPPLEGAFLACSLWLADAYVLSGDLDKAQILFDRVVGVANDVGLLAEEYDSVARRQTGNFPQALTHIALINTAHNLSAARQSSEKPAIQRSK
ncbi:glycoside hydrolase family 15 protein [Bradyrhizobium manausense]|uniref:glycoside hydrolase family 15 protein n=1 Tax=Bradyrhizobium manausense TaxID=989370 RepID=UPI001BA48DED|nr:glycoside hydrolase family 15 protein [Bradyrhizobium manausense]MBR0836772.1 glycoside hydrolase family 15 protein [Bradyrhizobium manausense]